MTLQVIQDMGGIPKKVVRMFEKYKIIKKIG